MDEEEMYKPRIYKRITKMGTIQLTVDDYDIGYLTIEIEKGEGFSLVHDCESGLILRLPEEIYDEAMNAKKEEDLWKIWKKILSEEAKFQQQMLELERKLYAEKIRGVLEIMQRALQGEEVEIDADFFVLEEKLGREGEIISAKVSACVSGFLITCLYHGGKEVRKFFKPPELFRVLYKAKAEPQDWADKRAFGAYADI